MNKKGAAPAIFWVIIAIVGIMVANQYDLFATFTPQVGQPVGADSLVNKVYYGDAVSDSDFACEVGDIINFRGPGINSNLWRTAKTIAFSSKCSNINPSSVPIILDGYGRVGYGDSASRETCKSNAEDKGWEFIQNVPGDLRSIKTGRTSGSGCTNDEYTGISELYKINSNELAVCYSCKDHNRAQFYIFSKTDLDADNEQPSFYSTSSQGGGEAKCSDMPIKGDPKYSCINNDAYKSYCGVFGEELIQDCASNQACIFQSNFQTPDGFMDIVKCGGIYKPSQKLCVNNLLYETSVDGSAIDVETCGYACVNNQCITCQDGQKRCSGSPTSSSDIELCSGGQWIEQPTKCVGLENCFDGECVSPIEIGQRRCFGNQPQIVSSGKIWVNEGEVCDLQCVQEGNDVTCQNECDPLGYICGAGILSQCINLDRDRNLETVGSCVSGQCSENGLSCDPSKSVGDKYCLGDSVYASVSTGNSNDLNGGAKGQLVKDCLNGCQLIDGEPQCKLALGCENKLGLSICRDTATKVVCSQDGQTYLSTKDCSIVEGGFCGVENEVGVCKEPEKQCEGNSICTGGNAIRECNNGVIGEIINECSGLGCSSTVDGLPQCNDECAQLDRYECVGGDSFKCSQSETSAQKILELQLECKSGCEAETGRCKLFGEANTFTCINTNEIWPIDENGQLGNKLDTCGLTDNSYCSEGTDFCKYCELNDIFCGANAQYRCEDETIPEGIVKLQDCDAGCVKSQGILYCDQFSLISNPTQNFFSSEDVVAELQIKGSKSGLGLITPYTGIITGPGVSDTKTGSSDSSGNININFGKKQLGEYTIDISLTNYHDESISVTSIVTNEFRTKVSGPQVLTKLPGVKTITQLESIDSNDLAADDLIVTTIPEGLTAKTISTSLLGKWDLEVDGATGIYEIGLSAVKQSVTLPEQTIQIELRKPLLQISSNIPKSTTDGTKTFDVFVSGPVEDSLTNENLKPDEITAELKGEQILLLDLGSGHYTFETDLVTIGTHTITAEASKEGYDSITYSYQFEVSESGDVAPPTSVGGDTTTTTIPGTTTTTTPSGDLFGFSYTQIGIVLAIMAGMYFFFGRKR